MLISKTFYSFKTKNWIHPLSRFNALAPETIEMKTMAYITSGNWRSLTIELIFNLLSIHWLYLTWTKTTITKRNYNKTNQETNKLKNKKTQTNKRTKTTNKHINKQKQKNKEAKNKFFLYFSYESWSSSLYFPNSAWTFHRLLFCMKLTRELFFSFCLVDAAIIVVFMNVIFSSLK